MSDNFDASHILVDFQKDFVKIVHIERNQFSTFCPYKIDD